MVIVPKLELGFRTDTEVEFHDPGQGRGSRTGWVLKWGSTGSGFETAAGVGIGIEFSDRDREGVSRMEVGRLRGQGWVLGLRSVFEVKVGVGFLDECVGQVLR
ncbi:hypothetical protein TIFTF001_045337 [Ficus carica]|uniref:Uncharacterized protein n=1 Tax=Ficus carica TaxID=3494 RepID=A0AA87YQT2_FICCA|nr:hypothetical protein TIFTF001_045337 [Ficus carica]